MNLSAPHYLLFSDLSDNGEPGRWRFILRASDGTRHLEAEDVEPCLQGERLELLTVVRGLEALEEPARVTLVTASTYVREGIRHGVGEWRRNGWKWERFGQMVPVKHLDLWQRIDRAMQYHQIDCRTFRFDPPHRITEGSQATACASRADAPRPPAPRRSLEYRVERFAPTFRRRAASVVRQAAARLVRWWNTRSPRLWLG